MVPYFIIIPLHQDSQIEIYEERSEAIVGKKKNSYILNIPVGTMFIGRYDCIHAGVGYKKCNTRLHLYLFPNGQDESTWKQEDRVYFISEKIKCDTSTIYSTTNKHQREVAVMHGRQIADKVNERKRKRQKQTEKALAARNIKQSK